MSRGDFFQETLEPRRHPEEALPEHAQACASQQRPAPESAQVCRLEVVTHLRHPKPQRLGDPQSNHQDPQPCPRQPWHRSANTLWSFDPIIRQALLEQPAFQLALIKAQSAGDIG